MKKNILLFAIGVFFTIVTTINVNMGRKNNSFVASVLSDIEAYASSSEGGTEGRKCGRSAYQWSPGTDSFFVQCAKGCPDKQGSNPLFKDC